MSDHCGEDKEAGCSLKLHVYLKMSVSQSKVKNQTLIYNFSKVEGIITQLEGIVENSYIVSFVKITNTFNVSFFVDAIAVQPNFIVS